MRGTFIRGWSLVWIYLLLAGLILVTQGWQPRTVRGAAPTSASPLPLYYAPNLPTGTSQHRIGLATHPWWLDMHLETFIYHFKQLKVGVIRMPVEWKTLEPQPGQYDWSRNDRLLNRLNDEGFTIIAEFITIPVWASSNPTVCAGKDIECALSPKAASNLEAVAQATTRRYPFIRQWEFWNEPEQWANFGSQPENYAAWLKVFYQAMKRADPTLLVAATTLSGPDYLNVLYRFMETSSSDHQSPWDAIAYHPYNLDNERDEGGIAFIAKKRIERIHQMMVEHGEGNKPLWISEIYFEGLPRNQADMLRQAFDWMTARPYITNIALHMLHDWSEEEVGLMTTDPPTFRYQGDITPKTRFIPKQLYYDAYKNYPKRPLRARPSDNPTSLVFSQTSHLVYGVFKQAWQRRGGLELFGYPKTGQFYERNQADGRYYLVQYFERVRMEYHPDLQGTPYEVQYGLLGNELMVEQGLLDQQGQPKTSAARPETPLPDGSDNQFFPQTSHNLNGLFLAAWRKQGGLSIVGYPRSRVFEEAGADGQLRLVQYFERARLELHTGPDGGQFILFGLLANQRLASQGRLDQFYQPVQSDYYNPANVEF